MNRSALILAAACVVAVAATAPRVDAAQTGATKKVGGKVTINFEAVQLPVFVKFISKVTGRNFVFTDTTQGVVTVVSPKPVTVDEAYTVFQSVLSVRGLTTIDDGVITRIVPIREARNQGASMPLPGRSGGGFATRLIPVKHVDVRELAQSLTPLVSKEGTLVAYHPTNTIIVSDLTLNTDRMARVVKALDTPSQGATVKVIPLAHADAKTTASQILETLNGQVKTRPGKGAQAPSGGSLRIVPDERTNSLIVTGGIVDLQHVRDLVHELDTPVRAGGERIHVYYAKHADAEDLVTVLTAIVTASRSKRGSAKTEIKQAISGNLGLSENVTLSADPSTNAVIVDADPQAYNIVLGLIQDLDIERPQVFVEAILVEVSVDRSRDFGFEFQGGADIGKGVGLASTNLASLGAITTGVANPFSLSGLIISAASDRTVQLPDGTQVPANVALFRALAADSDVNVLSAPTLLTLDNQEAEIVVGQNVPFVSGRQADTTNVNSVFTTVERRDVGIRLKVTPQVSEGDTVILKVDEEVSAVVPNDLLDANVVGPTTTIRSASTTVSVADARTAVIGGLISERFTTRQSRVPFLSKIPILGALFRADSKSNGKVNLIAFLTPHVIRNSADLRRVTEESKERYQGSLKNTVNNDRWPKPDSKRWIPKGSGSTKAPATNKPRPSHSDSKAATTDEGLTIIDDYRDRF